MVDAPWIKVLVEGGNIVCFDMRNGLRRHTQYLVDAAAHVKAFVVSHMNTERITTNCAEQGEANSMDFEECAVVVGSTVTIVGKLCRGPGGQLSLQRWQDSTAQNPEDGQEQKQGPLDWLGRVLITDDTAIRGRVKSR
jgi:hypothetical protein